MNELTQTKLAKPMDQSQMGQDVAAINALCGFLNSPLITGAEVPPDQRPTNAAAALASTLPIAPARPAATVLTPAPARPAATVNLAKVFYTGRLCSGKDHVAALTGATIEGFAKPLYGLATFFFGVSVDANQNKDLPGMRSFLQTVGQWGRGEVSAQYPYTPARATFIAAIRSLGAAGLLSRDEGVTWADYGRSENLWLDAALVRIAVNKPERLAITNVRFGNEFKRLSEQGFSNWHVMTTPNEWQARLAKRGVKPDAPALKDVSEQLAIGLDNQVTREISRQKTGAKLRVIWNSATPPPSPRLWTVPEFLRAGQIAAAALPSEDIVLTGE